MFGPTLTLSSFWEFSPHLLDPLQHHVAVSVKSLHSAQQLLVVPELMRHFMQNLFSLINALPAVDQDLGVVLDGVGEDPEGPGGELLLLLRLPLLGGHVRLARHPRTPDPSHPHPRGFSSVRGTQMAQAPFPS